VFVYMSVNTYVTCRCICIYFHNQVDRKKTPPGGVFLPIKVIPACVYACMQMYLNVYVTVHVHMNT